MISERAREQNKIPTMKEKQENKKMGNEEIRQRKIASILMKRLASAPDPRTLLSLSNGRSSTSFLVHLNLSTGRRYLVVDENTKKSKKKKNKEEEEEEDSSSEDAMELDEDDDQKSSSSSRKKMSQKVVKYCI